MTPVQIGLCVAAGVFALLVVAPSLKGAAGRVVAFFTKAKTGDLAGAVQDAIASSPIVQKAQELGVTGKNIVSYTDIKIASMIVPALVDPDKQAETKVFFAGILTNMATAGLSATSAPVAPASPTAL